MSHEQYEKKGYLLEDFRLFHLRGAQGVKAEYHYHEFCKLLLLISGSGAYSIAARQYALQSGDIVLVDSHCVHRPEFQPDAPYERLILYISPDFLRRCSTPDCDLTELFSGKWGHVLRSPHATRLLQLAAKLEAELAGPEYGRVLLSNVLLLRLLVEIGRQLRSGGVPATVPMQPTNARILAMLDYIHAHIDEDISIETLSEEFFLSKYHMMHLFRQETGQSIYGYITHRRLMVARELIAGGIPATEAAFRAGFGSYSSFTRAYGKRYGTTPTGRHPKATKFDETYE